MATLNTLINARYKEPSVTVKFNGNRTRDIVSVSVNTQLEGSIGSASIRTLSNPNTQPEARVVIRQGYNGKEQTTFTGYIDTIERNESDNTFTVNCRDVLKKALDTFLVQEIKFGQDIAAGQYFYSTYTSNDGGTFTIHQYDSIAALNAAHPETTGNYTGQGVKAEAVVQWLLHMSGLAEGTEIQVDETNFWIGDLNPAKFHLTSVYDAAMQIANLIGWRIYADPTGVARFRRKPRQPGGYTYWKYTDKGEPYNIHRLTKTSSNVDLRNYVEVRGASGIRTVLRAASPYIGNTPYRGVLISEELIDTQGIADFIAARVLGDLNRLKITVSLEADGNPILTPGSTLDITSTAAVGKYLVESVQTQESADAGYKMTIGAAAYLGDTKFDEDPDPVVVAAFVPTAVYILGDPKYIVTLDGAGSYSDRGAIANYYWQWPDGSTTNGPDSTATFVFDSANITGGNSQNVTLTVTDAVGNTGSVTQAITSSGLTAAVEPKYRHLYGALTTIAVGSSDGGQTWNTSALPAISVAASNFEPGGVFVASGHALFGTSDGKIYKTSDVCISVYQVLAPGGEVTDIHIPEMDSTRGLAGTSTGKVYATNDRGETWRLLHTFPYAVREVKMGFTDFKYIEVVCSGAGHVFQSFDSGANWSVLGTTLDVLWATDGSSTNYYAHTTGVAAGGTALTFADSAQHNVPAATVMIDRDDGVMIVDNTGQHWVYESGTFNQTQDNSANLTRHMIRDGEMEQVVYYATQSGISKSIDRNTTIDFLYYPVGSMPTGGWGKKVAYGPLAGIVTPGRLLFRGITSVLDGEFQPTNNGWHIATTSGWFYSGVPNVNGPVALTVGGIALSKTDFPGKIDYIECISASGAEGILGLVNHPDWVDIGTADINGFSFNNRPDSPDMLCIVYHTGPDGISQSFYATSIKNFTSAELQEQTGPTTMDGPGPVRSQFKSFTTSTLGEMVVVFNFTFFSPPNNCSVVFNSDGSHDVTSTIVFGPVWAPYQKNAKQYKGMVKDGSDIKLCTGYNGTIFVTEDTQIPSSDVLGFDVPWYTDFLPQIYGSVIDQSRIYYATAAGVFYGDSYGQGDQIQIFNIDNVVPSGYVRWFAVSHDKARTTDYITVIAHKTGELDSWSFYSNDGGQTFIQGPRLYNTGLSGNGELYLIDLPTTTIIS